MMRRMENPDFRPPPGGSATEWDRMRASPTGLVRPLVVMSGWRAPRWRGAALAKRMRRLVGAPREMFLPVSFTWCWSFSAAATRAVAAVERRWPSADSEGTVEVDVIGVSMGG